MATKSSNSEKIGFVTTGYIDKQGTAQGDSAMFNQMPPGMDITNQDEPVSVFDFNPTNPKEKIVGNMMDIKNPIPPRA